LVFPIVTIFASPKPFHFAFEIRIGGFFRSRLLDLTVVVAVVAVRVVQVATHQIIDVVAVGDRLVSMFRSPFEMSFITFFERDMMNVTPNTKERLS
jgi:hypothetical protein